MAGLAFLVRKAIRNWLASRSMKATRRPSMNLRIPTELAIQRATYKLGRRGREYLLTRL